MMISKQSKRIIIALGICNWIFGLGIIHYPLGRAHPIISAIYSSICVSSYCLVSTLAYPHMINWSLERVKTSIPFNYFFYSNVILVISVTALARYRSEEIFQSLKRVIIANDLMRRLSANTSAKNMAGAYIRNLIISTILVLIVIATNVIYVSMEQGSIYVKIITIISLCHPIVVMLAADMTFTVRVNVLSRKYQILNEKLRDILKVEPHLPRHQLLLRYPTNNGENELSLVTINHDEATAIIKLAKKIHLQLLKICEEVNKSHGVQILFSIIVAFGNITGHAYITYILLHESFVKRSLAYNYHLYSGMWTIYYAIKIFNFTEACTQCKQNAIRTGVILNKLYDEPFANDQVKAEIRNFNVQLIQRPLNFTAAGYITLDTHLIQIMISSITTYLMIFIDLRSEPS